MLSHPEFCGAGGCSAVWQARFPRVRKQCLTCLALPAWHRWRVSIQVAPTGPEGEEGKHGIQGPLSPGGRDNFGNFWILKLTPPLQNERSNRWGLMRFYYASCPHLPRAERPMLKAPYVSWHVGEVLRCTKVNRAIGLVESISTHTWSRRLHA